MVLSPSDYLRTSRLSEGSQDGSVAMMDYVRWLEQQGVALYDCGGPPRWRRHGRALIPASVVPCYLDAPPDARSLLRASGAWFLRYSSHPSPLEKSWWYVICDTHDPAARSSNTRSKVNRGHRACEVRRVSAQWLADNGYACHKAAFEHYGTAAPLSEEDFRRGMLAKGGEPFELWAVSICGDLAGYCECVVESGYAATSVIKLHPAYLKRYSSYALFDRLVEHYVGADGLTLSNGNRSVSHDTNIQEFLLKFNFRRQFCRLNVAYRPTLALATRLAYPLRAWVEGLPQDCVPIELVALLRQEHFRRMSGS